MTDLEIIDCEQGSPEWHQSRCGMVTASEFATVLARGKAGAPSKTRQTYLYTLAGQVLTGEVCESYTNGHMERGKIMEDEARQFYILMTDNEPHQVGFLKRGRAGCSPDGLIGTDGALEIKTKLPHLHIATILADEVPPEHVAQCQGALWVSGREWIDFQSYWPKMPPFIKRMHRDEVYIATLASAVDQFVDELDTLVEKLRGMA